MAIQPGDLRRYRGMARKLFALAEKHGLEMYYEGGKLGKARDAIRDYYGLRPGETL